MSGNCPFCSLPADRIILESELVAGFWDGYPISPGHALIVPRRHAETWFDLSAEEQAAMTAVINEVRACIEEEHSPDAYNIGVNSGPAAGQTVPHVHVHVIPRYEGDVDDPRGGVRCVVPAKANYWSKSG